MATAVEAYAVDHNHIPYSQLPLDPQRDWVSPGGFPLGSAGNPGKLCAGITTPVAYITSLPVDIFDTKLPPRDGYQNALHYVGARFGYDRSAISVTPMPIPVPADSASGSAPPYGGIGPDTIVQDGANGRVPGPYAIYSHGPDGVFFLDPNGDGTPEVVSIFNANNVYDPTNGTVSAGNVVRYPGGQNTP
jgi:hypothetical protein